MSALWIQTTGVSSSAISPEMVSKFVEKGIFFDPVAGIGLIIAATATGAVVTCAVVKGIDIAISVIRPDPKAT